VEENPLHCLKTAPHFDVFENGVLRPGMAYGAVAAWQSAPVDRVQFFPEYARQRYPTTAVAPVLERLAAAEVHLQKALGRDTMVALWGDAFRASSLQRCSQHRDDLRQARLLAEEASNASTGSGCKLIWKFRQKLSTRAALAEAGGADED